MRNKNVYQCNKNCINCNHEKARPTGIGFIDECLSDFCPFGNEKLGNIDKIGGRHTEGYGWNPLGEFCNFCKHETCDGCIKWSNREKKLRNLIPTELKPFVTKKTQISKNIVSKIKDKDVVAKKEEDENKQIMSDTQETPIKEVVGLFDTQQDTFVDNKKLKNIEDVTDEDIVAEYNETQTDDEIDELSEFNDDNSEDEDIDFGEGLNNDEYSYETYSDDVDFDEDEIPKPVEYEEYNEDDEDEDFDEDEDADFEMFVQTKRLKSPMLFSKGEKIAKYQVRNLGIILNAQGDAKVTVRGKNDSDGFSYRDSSRFPR